MSRHKLEAVNKLEHKLCLLYRIPYFCSTPGAGDFLCRSHLYQTVTPCSWPKFPFNGIPKEQRHSILRHIGCFSLSATKKPRPHMGAAGEISDRWITTGGSSSGTRKQGRRLTRRGVQCCGVHTLVFLPSPK